VDLGDHITQFMAIPKRFFLKQAILLSNTHLMLLKLVAFGQQFILEITALQLIDQPVN